MKKLLRKKRQLGIGISVFFMLLLASVMFIFMFGVTEVVVLSPPFAPVAGVDVVSSPITTLSVFIGISFFLFLVTVAILYYFLTH